MRRSDIDGAGTDSRRGPDAVGKKQGGKTYYFLVESARVGGKPRIVSQRYLGSAEEIATRLGMTRVPAVTDIAPAYLGAGWSRECYQ